MSPQGYSPTAGIPIPSNGRGAPVIAKPPRPRYWLHILLLCVTVLTSTAWGWRMAENFALNRPAFSLEQDFEALLNVWRTPWVLLAGLPFSLTLLTVLVAHELGHYVACRRYGVNATLPYFIPFFTIFGTLGAFIRIRSPIYSKKVLFDIGIAGPLAGFVFVLPALGIGLAYSKLLPGIGHHGDVVFGVPPLLWLAEKLVFPGAAAADIYLHPIARAAWAGIFSTGLNLLPIGQLDGGHILYSFIGERHRMLSKVFAAGLVPLGLFSQYWAWLVWALILLIFGLRHPSIFDATRLDPGRRTLGWVALAMFLLCFMAAPVKA